MTATSGRVFADTSFWIALVLKRDRYHPRASGCLRRYSGEIVTTAAVLIETANALSRPESRSSVISLINQLLEQPGVHIVESSNSQWKRGWDLYRNRPDKSWSLTDCISFIVMQDSGLIDALTTDDHFRQAGFRPLLLEEQGT